MSVDLSFGRYGESLFSHSRSGEAERLENLSLTFDAITCRQLSDRGLPSGGRCLDVGAGTGSVAAWLAAQPELTTGDVYALDRDVRLLAKRVAQHTNLHVIEHDISTPLPDDWLNRFDLVHARYVLMHLRDRRAVFERLVACVKPGGWIILSDGIDLITPTSEPSAYRQVMSATWNRLHAMIGSDANWAGTMPQELQRSGFQEIGAEVFVPVLHAHSPVARFWQLTLAQMREALLAEDSIDQATFEQAQHAFTNPDLFEIPPGMLTAWGRRPD
jgi:SAM-dependent methyltransferase